jgi:hypothetical protein
MDKDTAIKLAGSASALAKMLGITRQAVGGWVEIPQMRLYQLRVLKPRWFRGVGK